jgi:DNA-damage-inducible protein J
MTASSMIHVRVDEATKTQATEALAAMGLSVSDAVRALLVRVAVEKELPFVLRVPNAETLAAMKEARSLVGARFTAAPDMMNALTEESR